MFREFGSFIKKATPSAEKLTDGVAMNTERAASGTRTHDLFVTNEMLYQLSYCGGFDNAKL